MSRKSVQVIFESLALTKFHFLINRYQQDPANQHICSYSRCDHRSTHLAVATYEEVWPCVLQLHKANQNKINTTTIITWYHSVS